MVMQYFKPLSTLIVGILLGAVIIPRVLSAVKK